MLVSDNHSEHSQPVCKPRALGDMLCEKRALATTEEEIDPVIGKFDCRCDSNSDDKPSKVKMELQLETSAVPESDATTPTRRPIPRGETQRKDVVEVHHEDSLPVTPTLP